MPLKNRSEYNAYLKQYRRHNSQIKITKRYYALVIQQFKELTILPRHIYTLKQVLRQMMLNHFQKRILIKRDKTNLITQSYKSILLY